MRRAGLRNVPALARAMYASLGTSIFEFLWLVGRRAPPPSALVWSERARAVLVERGWDARPTSVDAWPGIPWPNVRSGPCAPPRGLVVATAHTGNWDFVGCALSRSHFDLTVVTKRLSVPWLDRFWQERRASFGIELVDGSGAFARAVDAIRHGRAVGLLIDQVPERRSAVTEIAFLGSPARCDTTAALLAARTGAPLVLALARRLPDGRHCVDVPLRLDPPARASRVWIEEATRALNLALEQFVREHPPQWLWMHRRWKTGADLGLTERRCTAAPASGAAARKGWTKPNPRRSRGGVGTVPS